MDSYQQAYADAITRYIDENCHRAPDAKVPATTLYTAALQWFRAGNVPPITQTQFGRLLTELGYTRKRGSAGAFYAGIGLK